jgi:hypothetical protein
VYTSQTILILIHEFVQLKLIFDFLEIPLTIAQKGLVRSPLQKPMSSPVSPIHSRTPITAALAMPAFVPERDLRAPGAEA